MSAKTSVSQTRDAFSEDSAAAVDEHAAGDSGSYFGRYFTRFRLRFEAATGHVPLSLSADGLPVQVLAQACCSPETIVALLPVRPRTRNTLQRYLADCPSTEGPWTLGRLTRAVPGFGAQALLDVIESSRRTPPVERTDLTDELRRELAILIARREAPRGGLPRLRRVFELIEADLPASEAQIRERLARDGFHGELPSMTAIERAARRTDGGAPFSVLRTRGSSVVVPPSELARAKHLVNVVARVASQWGPVQLDHLVRGTPGAKGLPRRFIVALVEGLRGFRWLDRSAGWFWLSSERPKIVAAIEQQLRARGAAAPLEDVVASSFRRSTFGVFPPAEVVAAFIEGVATLRVVGEHVCLVR